MSRAPIWTRVYRRLHREIDACRHARHDAALLRRAAGDEISTRAIERIAARLAGETAEPDVRALVLPRSPASLGDRWRRRIPQGPEQTTAAAQELLADRVTLFGVSVALADPTAWHQDFSSQVSARAERDRDAAADQRTEPRSGLWPLRPHRQIRLVGPRAPGDVRIQWEPARFQHALLLGQAYLASGDGAYAEAFRRHVDSFLAGNPPYRGIHWAVGMEVAIRAAAWVFALEFLRGADALTAEWCRAVARALLLHGLFLETHVERHPLDFTTNHTVADYAGLAVLGRLFAETEAGERWRALSGPGLAMCLEEQVLAEGAHAEGSLPYQRFVLEAALVSARCLDPEQAAPLRPGIRALARHLRAATLGGGMPFVGDGDDSFFPPFACAPFTEWDPLDPEAVLQVAADWCAEPSLRGSSPARAAALWLGAWGEDEHAITGVASGGAPSDAERLATPAGFRRLEAGPFSGLLIVRSSGEGWLPTHEHNDLLSLLLEVDGTPLLIDPGTGAYGLNPRVRHALRSTAAHSTLQLDEREQSSIDALRLFEGPPAVPGGVGRAAEAEPASSLPLEAWHDGFGKGFRHLRRISQVGGVLWIEDRLGETSRGSEVPTPGRQALHGSTLRFRLAPGLTLRELEPQAEISGLGLPPESSGVFAEPSDSQGIMSLSRARIEVPGGEVDFLLLHPEKALWQIVSGAISRRYGSWREAPILQARWSGPLPHRWLTGIRYRPRN